MARRPQQHTVWNAGTFVNILTIPALTAAISFMGFYFSTAAKLTQFDADIRALVANAQENQKNIAALTATTMVQTEQIKGINTALDRVVTVLSAPKR